MVTTLFVIVGAWLLAMIGSVAFVQRASREAGQAAEERARMIEAIASLGF